METSPCTIAGKKKVSIRPFTAHLFSKKKIQFETLNIACIKNGYLNVCYLCFLNSNDRKCSCSKSTIRCTLNALTLGLCGDS